jgi:hypothetical protein
VRGPRVIRAPGGLEFARLFTEVRHSWFRLETLQRYDAEYERDDFAAFLRGKPITTTPGPWQTMLRDHVAAGRQLARVHVIEEPPSDYIRYELAAYRLNAEAGEEVRLMPVRRGSWPPDIPAHDYWLFDDQRLWLMDYDPAGAFVQTRLVEEPIAIDQHRRWRDIALESSIPLNDYHPTHQPP